MSRIVDADGREWDGGLPELTGSGDPDDLGWFADDEGNYVDPMGFLAERPGYEDGEGWVGEFGPHGNQMLSEFVERRDFSPEEERGLQAERDDVLEDYLRRGLVEPGELDDDEYGLGLGDWKGDGGDEDD